MKKIAAKPVTKMRSQKPIEHFGSSVCIDSSESEKGDILCYHPSFEFNRETYQMSPLLFESDTDDTSQSTEIKCYQEKTITPPKANNQQFFDILSTLTDLRNEISSQLDTSSQHNQCCSETLLNLSNHKNLNDTKSNTNNCYVSPSPRVTRSKLLNSRILTRSAKRLHKISDSNATLGSSRNTRMRNESNKGRKRSTSVKDSNVTETASHNDINENTLIESIRKSNVKVVLTRLKPPFIQYPTPISAKFIQPNIVPNIELYDTDNELDFLNRRLSSEVQVFTEKPAVISISSESSVRSESTPYLQRVSPDLFENCESSSVSNLCSQNSFDIPNGQVLLSNVDIAEDTTSTPNDQHNSTLVPSIHDLFDSVTPDVDACRRKFIDERCNKVAGHTFEITVNEVFDNVVHLTDSERTLKSQPYNKIDAKNKTVLPDVRSSARKDKPRNTDKSDNLYNLIDLTKLRSSQEVTPKRRPGITSFLRKSPPSSKLNTSTTLTRSKWLSRPRTSNSDSDLLNRTTYRCRRLDLWFEDRGNKSMMEVKKRSKMFDGLLSSSEEDDS